MSPRPRVAAVVFDLFDTLVDLHMEGLPRIERRGARITGTARALHETLARSVPEVPFDVFADTLSQVDLEFRESRYARGLELPTRERFAVLLERLAVRDDALVLRLVEVHMAALRAQVRSLAHHPRVLADLHTRVPLALCSNFSHSETALRVLREAGLDTHLDAVVVSDATGFRKPRPEIFQAVLDALGTAPEATLHVGDNLSADIAGAAALGMQTAWLTRRVPDPDARLRDHTGPPPDHRIDDLSELPALLDD